MYRSDDLVFAVFRVCTINGVALVGGLTCPPNNASINESCSENNFALQEIYMEVSSSLGVNMTIYDPARDPPWEDGFVPTCQIGIPGISRPKTVVGQLHVRYGTQLTLLLSFNQKTRVLPIYNKERELLESLPLAIKLKQPLQVHFLSSLEYSFHL